MKGEGEGGTHAFQPLAQMLIDKQRDELGRFIVHVDERPKALFKA